MRSINCLARERVPMARTGNLLLSAPAAQLSTARRCPRVDLTDWQWRTVTKGRRILGAHHLHSPSTLSTATGTMTLRRPATRPSMH